MQAVLLHSHFPSVDDVDAFLSGLAAQLAHVYRVAVVGIVADADVFYACRLRRLPLVGVYLQAIIIGFCHARSSCRCNATSFPSCFLSRGSAALHRLPILYPTAGALFVDIQIKIIRNEPRCEAVPDFLKYNNQE